MKISALQTGTVAVKEVQREGHGRGPARILNILRAKQWTDPLPIYVWVVEHPEGTIVIDTGETARVMEPGYFPRWQPYFRLAVRFAVRPDQEVGPQLESLGLASAAVRWVVITHLHSDHAGGLAHFPNAEILVTRSEFEAARGRLGKLNGYLPQRWPQWFSPTLVDFTDGPFGPDERRVVERLSQNDAVTALADLPHDFRDVVLLVDLADFTYSDAAQILDIPIGTVMSRLHRGRRMLKGALATSAADES